ncbi:MAG: undecaprenyl-diphosphate phosphatase [Patescibacteria group bacterium]|nr:undecaprenyl-diphosphate phosphatase [Patescibacteria group bacterium]
MISYPQAVVFGLIQGITELFPISSLGHSVILPKVFNWNINQNDPFFLTFLVATHAATSLILFIFFRKDWRRIILGIIRSLKEREIKATDADAKLGWLLVTATIPAGILGLLFEEQLKTLFASPNVVAFVLMLNGLLLFGAEILRRKTKEETAMGSDERIARISYSKAIKVGLMQSLALIPGFSRTGATITGGLLVGLSHEDAARYSFLLATPIIGAAAFLKLPELNTQGESAFIGRALVGALFAAIAAYLSVRFLIKYFEAKNLTPFAVYCIVIGGLTSLLFFFR